MKTVFISDAHLKGPGDPNQPLFVKFLDSLEGVSTLVVLGDLFDFWTGANRVVEGYYRPVLDAFARLRKKGTRIVYCEGNHDFAMGGFFTSTLGATVYPRFGELSIDGMKFLIAHGDTIAMTTGYMLWRAYLRSPLFRLMAWAATPAVVWKIAMRLSKKSRKRTYKVKSNITEASLRDYARKELADGVEAVVFGHSHLAGIHREGNGVYANPGSWAGGTYLVHEGGRFRVERWNEKASV